MHKLDYNRDVVVDFLSKFVGRKLTNINFYTLKGCAIWYSLFYFLHKEIRA